MVTSPQLQPSAGASRISRSTVLALIGVTLALHNGEEFFAFPIFLPSLGHRMPSWMPSPATQHNIANLRIALIFAAVLPCIVIACAIITRIHGFLIASLFVEVILLVNAFAHTLTALLLRSYVPGLVTAILINLPFGIYVFRRSIREGWISRYRAWQLVIVAILIHVVWLATGIMRAQGVSR